jgi:hypothetical protein
MIAADQASTTRHRLQNVDKTGEFFNRIGRLLSRTPGSKYCGGRSHDHDDYECERHDRPVLAHQLKVLNSQPPRQWNGQERDSYQ